MNQSHYPTNSAQLDIEDPVETTAHIKMDTIKLQERLHKEKINTKDNPTENGTTNPTKKKKKKKKHKLQKVDIDQLQDQRKKLPSN